MSDGGDGGNCWLMTVGGRAGHWQSRGASTAAAAMVALASAAATVVVVVAIGQQQGSGVAVRAGVHIF